jgi:hypothetical protein
VLVSHSLLEGRVIVPEANSKKELCKVCGAHL